MCSVLSSHQEPTSTVLEMTSPPTDADLSASEPLVEVETNREDVGAVSTPEQESLKLDTGSSFNQSTGTGDASKGQYEVCAEGDDVSEGSFDIHTQTDGVSTATDDSVYAPDGGWGWVVTFASFMVAFIVDGMVTSFGLLLPELLTTYGAGVSLTSFPPAIIVAMFLLSGPMTAYFVRRWGCRPVGFCGGLLAALGVAGSAYAPNIELFILSYGVVAGVGVGLIYLPSVTMVNLYFNKKRGMVAGIVTSGSGFGLLAMAPLTEMLIGEYGWRGCYLIMAGITLHFCVCASLMRPLTPPKRRLSLDDHHHSRLHLGTVAEEEESLTGGEEEEGGSRYKTPPDEGTRYNDTYSIHSRSRHDSTRFTDNVDDDLGLAIVSVEEIPNGAPHSLQQQARSQFGSVWSAKSNTGSGVWSSVKNLFLGNHALASSHAQFGKRRESWRDQGAAIPRSRSHGHLQTSASRKASLSNNGHINAFSAWLACQVPPTLSRRSLVSHQSTRDNTSHQWRPAPDDYLRRADRRVRSESFSHAPRPYHSEIRVLADQPPTPRFERREDFLKNLVMDSQHKAHDSPLMGLKVPPDKLSKENGTALPLIDETPPYTPSTPTDDSTSNSTAAGRVARWLREQRVFILFLAGAFLIQLVNNVTPLLTPSYAYLHGVSKDQVATILSVFGLANTLGRLMAGVLVYWGLRPLRVYNLGNLLAGVSCFIFPFCTTFPTIAFCLALHGLFLGAFPPLQSVILVEYLGIERLASTFGTMCLVKAFASSAGAPLAGLLYTITGVYTIPVVVCGAVSVLAAIVVQLMECFPKPRI